MRQDAIVVSGAREHNLKDISLALPRDALVVLTGLSGSGKSSLAFDTIYAEGQRRYVESLSAYARQFLGQMDKPDVDSIEGLSPAISIDQKTTSRNPRSTVGTVTEIYDYLRLLWARVGTPHCPDCGETIQGQSAEQIIDQVMDLEEGTRFMVLAPVVRGRKGEYGKLLDELRQEGYARVKVDGELRMLEEKIEPMRKYCHDGRRGRPARWARPDLRRRLADLIDTAVVASPMEWWRLELVADGDAGAGAGGHPKRFACLACGTSMPEPGAADVLVQFAARRLPAVHGPRLADGDRPGAGGRPDLDAGRGALLPWSTSASNYYEQMTQAIAERYEIDLETPWEDLPDDARGCFLHGTNGDRLYISYRNRYGRRRSCMTTSSRGSRRTSSAATARPTPSTRARRSRSTCRCGRA